MQTIVFHQISNGKKVYQEYFIGNIYPSVIAPGKVYARVPYSVRKRSSPLRMLIKKQVFMFGTPRANFVSLFSANVSCSMQFLRAVGRHFGHVFV